MSEERFREQMGSVGNSENSLTSPNNNEQESASNSMDSGFPESMSSIHRNYDRTSNRREDILNHNPENEDSAIEVAEAFVRQLGGELIIMENQVYESEEDEYFDREEDYDFYRPEDSEQDNENDSQPDNNDYFNDLFFPSYVIEEPAVLKKPQPKQNWFAIPEIVKRQIGYNSKFQSCDLFTRRFYGSLQSVQQLKLIYNLRGHNQDVRTVTFHPDGSLLASGCDEMKIAIWDWKTGRCVLTHDLNYDTVFCHSKFLNLTGDLHLATCTGDGQVTIAQISRQEGVRENRKLGTHQGPCYKLAVLADHPQVILSAGADAAVLIHDIRNSISEKILTVKDPHSVALYSIQGHPMRSHEFCVSGKNRFVRIYDQRKCDNPLGTYTPFKEVDGVFYVSCTVYNHDGTQILASYNGEDIYLFDVNNPEEGAFLHKYEGHRNGFSEINYVNFFGTKSEFVVSSSDCGYIFFWDKNTEAIVQCLNANGVFCMDPHPHLPFICSTGYNQFKEIKLWGPSPCEQTSKENEGEEKLNFAGLVKSNAQFIAMGTPAPYRSESSRVRGRAKLKVISPLFGGTNYLDHQIYVPTAFMSTYGLPQMSTYGLPQI